MNKGAVAGKFVIERFDYDSGRQVTVYVPPEKPVAIVFAADGQQVAHWGGLLEKSGTLPTMIVGVHGLVDENLRLEEYSPGFNPERFKSHEKFFVEQVRNWVESRFGLVFPKERTALFGASAGGELALALGLRYPGIYGAILCVSPGAGYKPVGTMPGVIPRTYFVAGKGESFFLANATRWAKALDNVGAEVVIKERDGSHGGKFWQAEFPLMIEWAFGNRSDPPDTYPGL